MIKLHIHEKKKQKPSSDECNDPGSLAHVHVHCPCSRNPKLRVVAEELDS